VFTPRAGGPPQLRRYLYEGYRCIEESDETGATIARCIYGNAPNEVIAMERDGRRYFYHHQHLGSISHITDEQGDVIEQYTYDDLGEATIRDGRAGYLLNLRSATRSDSPVAGTEDGWELVESVLEAIKDGASRKIGFAVGALLGYLLSKAVLGGVGGKLAGILGKVSGKINDFLKKFHLGEPHGGRIGGWDTAPGPGSGPPSRIFVSPENRRYREIYERLADQPDLPSDIAVDHMILKGYAKALGIPQVPLQELASGPNSTGCRAGQVRLPQARGATGQG